MLDLMLMGEECDLAMGSRCTWEFSISAVGGRGAEDPKVPMGPVGEHV